MWQIIWICSMRSGLELGSMSGSHRKDKFQLSQGNSYQRDYTKMDQTNSGQSKFFTF